MIYLEDSRPAVPPALAAKLAQGETPEGNLRQALTAIALIRNDLAEALTEDMGRFEIITHARNNLAGLASTIERALQQLERP